LKGAAENAALLGEDCRVQSAKLVGDQRYRETFGRNFEDFTVGDIYEHRPGKTITEFENHQFTMMTLNSHPMHFDTQFAAASEFKRNIVVSPYTLALLIGMSVTDVSYKAIANLGMDEVRFSAPVFAGDTLYGESEVLTKRLSKSRITQGIVSIRTIGRNQDGVVVCSFVRNMLIPCAGHGVEDRSEMY
jgi:itaconyl-CoA hydratase